MLDPATELIPHHCSFLPLCSFLVLSACPEPPAQLLPELHALRHLMMVASSCSRRALLQESPAWSSPPAAAS